MLLKFEFGARFGFLNLNSEPIFLRVFAWSLIILAGGDSRAMTARRWPFYWACPYCTTSTKFPMKPIQLQDMPIRTCFRWEYIHIARTKWMYESEIRCTKINSGGHTIQINSWRCTIRTYDLGKLIRALLRSLLRSY